MQTSCQNRANFVATFGSPIAARAYASGEYRYGFNGQEKENEFVGSGNHLAFYDRGYDSRLGRWNKVDTKQGKYPAWSPYHFGYNNPIITIDPDGKENIVVVGGQYDNSAGNKLMFVHQALRQLRQYQVNEKDETRSLVLFTEGYTENQIRKIEKAAAKYGATLIKINSADELINYINSKSTDNINLSTNRTGDPATNVDIFAHGLVGSFEFGYLQKNEEAAKFDASDASRLNSGAFGSGAVLTSYACRTGLGNSNIDIFAWPWEDLKKDKSLAQSISNSAGITVKAYLVRTNYSNTLSSTMDNIFLKTYEVGLLRDAASTLHYMSLQSELSNRELIDGAAFDPDGAMHPVTGGDSPSGVSDEMQTYSPKR